MPTNTVFHPRSLDEFNSSNVNYNGYGVYSSTINANAETDIDCSFADDLAVTGIELNIQNPQIGDYMQLMVVHPSGTILNTFVLRWIMGPVSFRTFYQINYPAKLFAGLILRAKYVSVTATAPTFVGINYGLHKILW